MFSNSDLKFSMEDGTEKAMNVFSLVYVLVRFRIENFSLNGMGGFDSFSLQIALDNLVWVLYFRCLKLVLDVIDLMESIYLRLPQ